MIILRAGPRLLFPGRAWLANHHYATELLKEPTSGWLAFTCFHLAGHG